VDADDLLARDGEEAERIGVAQVVLPREGQEAQVVQRAQLRCIGETLAIERDALAERGDERSQALELERAKLLAGHRLELGLEDHRRGGER
jgi:hypothetical protein